MVIYLCKFQQKMEKTFNKFFINDRIKFFKKYKQELQMYKIKSMELKLDHNLQNNLEN